MRLSAGETATFLALVGFAWNVKPLYGLVSDLVPAPRATGGGPTSS